jgi:HD-like signal output (HDOD) protein
MDFGAAARHHQNWLNGENVGVDEDFIGTPAYMAPEYIEKKLFSAKTDIFAAGLMVCEMLTGQRVYKSTGGGLNEVFHRIVHEPIVLPSSPGLDERIVACLLKALAKDPQARYDSVLEMKEALLGTTGNVPGTAGAPEGSDTLAFLLRRMKLKKEFPIMSDSISSVNRIIFSDNSSIGTLTNAVLKDFGLSSKIMKLANSAYYGRAGSGGIGTISGAVYRLGFDTIRNIVLSLLLFDQIKDRGQAGRLMSECMQAVLGGAIARQMCMSLRHANAEETFVCAMMHNLGRILSFYYFPEETEEIRKMLSLGELDEERASRKVLGASYTELGQGVAKIWGFPTKIIGSMDKRPPSGATRGAAGPDEKMRLMASMACELSAALVAETDPEERDRRTAESMDKYKGHLNIKPNALEGLVSQALEDFEKYASAAGWTFHKSLSRRLEPLRTPATARNVSNVSNVGNEEITVIGDVVSDDATEPPALPGSQPEAEAPPARLRQEARLNHSALSGGVQDITIAMVEGRSLSDILRIVVESIYTGIAFDHVIFASHDSRLSAILGRFGLGNEVDKLIAQFRFGLDFVPDVFHAALRHNIDVFIANTGDPKIVKRIPDWYRKAFNAGTMVVFPIVVRDEPFGLIYADAARANSIIVSDTELKLLRTLRNQALLAVRQSLSSW